LLQLAVCRSAETDAQANAMIPACVCGDGLLDGPRSRQTGGNNKWRIFPRRYAEWLERKGHRTSSASWVGTKRLWIWKTFAGTGKKRLNCVSPRLEGAASQVGSLQWARSTSLYTS